MKKMTRKLKLHRETLRNLDAKDVAAIRGAGTYTIEPPCEDTDYGCTDSNDCPQTTVACTLLI